MHVVLIAHVYSEIDMIALLEDRANVLGCITSSPISIWLQLTLVLLRQGEVGVQVYYRHSCIPPQCHATE